MDFEKRENITLIVVVIITALVFGAWGIHKLNEKPEEKPAQSDYYFKCTGVPYNYPDVMMNIRFERDTSAEQKQALIGAFSELFEHYNESREYAIHYMDAYNDEIADKNLTFYIDFGGADIDALEMFLNYLDQYTTGIESVFLE